jgi:Rrf2 family protein
MRALLALAMAFGEGNLMVKEIAERQHLPATYLEQLMVPLRKSGLVTAVRGAHGGYTLGRSPALMTIAEIIEVLEGPIQLTECPSGAGCCGHPEACALSELWSEASEALIHVFQQMTLANLVERQRAKEAASVLMYSI